MTFNPYSIEELIPQRPPMMMIDRFLGIDDDGLAHAELDIGADNIFCARGLFCESGLVEHIAQTAAARAGFLSLIHGEPVVLGFIGSIDKLQIRLLPPVGARLQTVLNVVSEVMNITLVHAQTSVDGHDVAECNMKIFLKK